MEEKTRNLCAQIPESLHARVRQEQEALGQTLGQYMTELITKYYEYIGDSSRDCTGDGPESGGIYFSLISQPRRFGEQFP